VNRVLLVGLVACGGSTRAPAPIAHATSTPACIADELGTLRPEWSTTSACGSAPDACLATCKRGDSNACFNLGLAFEYDHRDPQARELYERACRGGHALGCTNLGAHAWKFHLGPAACTFRLFERSCAADELMGCAMVGRMLVEAPEVRDVARGKAYLERMCEERKGPPCHFLAHYIEDGTLGEPDPARARELMKRACDGDPSACSE
jgi:uncharacterized protein